MNIFGDKEDKEKFENRMLGIIMLKKGKKRLKKQLEKLSGLFKRWRKGSKKVFKGGTCVMYGEYPQIWWWCEFEKKVREEEYERFLLQQGLHVKVLCRITDLNSLKKVFYLENFYYEKSLL
jgi:hypothetical protein